MFGLGVDEVNAISKIVLNISAIGAGIWALYTYKRSKRADASKWLHELFDKFYVNDKFFWARDTFEYGYETVVSPLLELRVTDRDIKLTEKQITDLRNIDLLLNFFEHLVYLEDEGIINRKDREVFFQYWFNFFSNPRRGGLRRYFAKCGYERLARYCNAPQTEYVALTDNQKNILNDSCYNFEGLVDVGKHSVISVMEFDYAEEVNVYMIGEICLIKEIDLVLQYFPNNRQKSRHLRTCVMVGSNRLDAWIYMGIQNETKHIDKKS